MTSPLQQLVASIQQNDYITLAMVTAIGYDYILTFPKEIEYVWMKPWTQVSTLFVIARYSGLVSSILTSMLGSTFFPGPAKTYVFVPCLILLNIPKGLNICRCRVVYSLSEWSLSIFMGAAELVMILRVWALYNRSTLVLYVLLTLYALEEISMLGSDVVFDIRFSSSAAVLDQVFQFSFCVQTGYPPGWLIYTPMGFGLTLGILMCLLTTIQLVKELLQMYRVTRRAELNPYVICLVREGMVYFVVMVMAFVVTILFDAALNTAVDLWLSLLGYVIPTVPPVVLVPRFILNLRELYAHDLRGRQGSHIDTGFGLGSGFERGTVRSAIAFADPGENENEERGDEMETEIQEVARTSDVV